MVDGSDSPGASGAAAPLEFLDLGENRLGALPPLGLYPRLREVHMQQNGIRELPVSEITPLMQLQTLDISMNDVSLLPPDLARLPRLQNLTIVGNPIRSIPQSVQQRGATAVIDLLRKRLPECS
jgi:Leucine-rich repeat (LRR) protein